MVDAKIGDISPPESLLEMGIFYQRENKVFCFRKDCAGCPGGGCEFDLATIKVGSGMNIRKAFCAQEGYTLAAIDYKQIELRVAAQLSGEPVWVEAFKTGKDLHSQMARIGWKIPEGQPVPKAIRDAAKCCNFGNLFLGSAYTLARQSDLTESEAVAAWKIWWDTVKTYKRFTLDQIAYYKKHRCVRTFFGRRRDMGAMIEKAEKSKDKKDWGFCDRTSVNSPIQGTAADLMKLGMVRVGSWIRRENLQEFVKVLLTVHDELVIEFKNCEQMYDLMREAGRQMTLTREGQELPDIKGWSIPLGVDIEIGPNWAEMVDIDKVDPNAKKKTDKEVVKVFETDEVVLIVTTLTEDQASQLLGIIARAQQAEGVKVPLKLMLKGKLHTSGTMSKVNRGILEEGIRKISGVAIRSLEISKIAAWG